MRTPDVERFLNNVVQTVAELPDRTSPADRPDMMLVTAAELRSIILDKLLHAGLEQIIEEEFAGGKKPEGHA